MCKWGKTKLEGKVTGAKSSLNLILRMMGTPGADYRMSGGISKE